jgi:hypothetical protein
MKRGLKRERQKRKRKKKKKKKEKYSENRTKKKKKWKRKKSTTIDFVNNHSDTARTHSSLASVSVPGQKGKVV